MKLNIEQSYPLHESLKERLLICFLFGLFVFLFLSIFQPFELNNFPTNLLLVTFGYGAICFAIMALLNIGVFFSFPNYFSTNSWTTGKEILWVTINVFIIGFGNYIFFLMVNVTSFSWWNSVLFISYTLLVGVFPLTDLILLNQVRLQSKFEKQSQHLNEEIKKKQIKYADQSIPSKISVPNEREYFELIVDAFLYAKSDDNYVNIYYLNNTSISRKMIRITLKKMDSLFVEHKDILKYHKSYIVNLKHVHRVSGNVQGYKLHLWNKDIIVPVSRALNKIIRSHFVDDH
jgi:hypothetical protein